MLAPPIHVRFGVEAFEAFYPEAVPLLEQHWKEIAPHQDIFKLNPDMATYRAMEKSGRFCIVTARLEGRLIGYVWLLIQRHLHYQDVKQASIVSVGTDDIHYLLPEYRKGWTGVNLLKAAEDEMRSRGVQVMYLRTKAAHDHGAIFLRLGYAPTDVVYSKRLDRG